jgi:hypothetical protein
MFVQITNAHGVAAKDVSILSVHVDAMPLPWTAVPTTVKYAARKDAEEAHRAVGLVPATAAASAWHT